MPPHVQPLVGLQATTVEHGPDAFFKVSSSVQLSHCPFSMMLSSLSATLRAVTGGIGVGPSPSLPPDFAGLQN
jgi:hypothetical protein